MQFVATNTAHLVCNWPIFSLSLMDKNVRTLRCDTRRHIYVRWKADEEPAQSNAQCALYQKKQKNTENLKTGCSDETVRVIVCGGSSTRGGSSGGTGEGRREGKGSNEPPLQILDPPLSPEERSKAMAGRICEAGSERVNMDDLHNERRLVTPLRNHCGQPD